MPDINKQFAQKYKELALQATKGTSIDPVTLLTQAAIESRQGRSDGAVKYGNYFGIKADPSWKGKKVLLTTTEEKNGKKYQTKAWFRQYDNPADSFYDYVKFLQENPRYKNAIAKQNYQDELNGILNAGYASGSGYKKLAKSISSSIYSGLYNKNAPAVIESKRKIYNLDQNVKNEETVDSLNPTLSYNPLDFTGITPVTNNLQLSPIQPFSTSYDIEPVSTVERFPISIQKQKESRLNKFGNGLLSNIRNPFNKQLSIEPSIQEQVVQQPILPVDQSISEQTQLVQTPVLPKEGAPSNMMRVPNYLENEILDNPVSNTNTSFISPLNPNYVAPKSNGFSMQNPFITSKATNTTTAGVQNIGTPSNMMRVNGYDETIQDDLNPPRGKDPITGIDPYMVEWLKDPVRNQMTKLEDIKITQDEPEKKDSNNHYLPYDFNPFTTGLNILNAGLNTVGGMRNMRRINKQENLNSFITQQPEAVYPNKRMLYGDKSMFAEYGGEYSHGGMYPDGGSVYDPDAYVGSLVQYKKGGIYIKPENKGKFTEWAQSHGMSVQEAASHVMANKEKYSSTTVKRANFAKNASKWKHEEGGEYAEGGEMIKRADGSYSKRGLWDNIRANKGSGKKPTKEMLKQEKKIKKGYKAGGEYMEGNEYEISGEELERLRSLGYDVEMI